MHHLIHHSDNISIDAYHTIRYFAENSLESIHALVNKFCCQFFQIDGTLCGKQVLHNMQLDKQDKYANERKLIKE